ncbi:TIGR04149 family rSAM-modified RiPP [Parabacteroides sp. Marseille-P3160]|uniref:TIGR04149 family rSAM-modified RiPP n=1 Tax=Parabacteroides sp. Marseille-P3160 TaxID=1917887 RepID=UPI0009BB8FE4|nr:TIGR04149 family rSAM-modified RiPP [Parabacteroides sp. Marseille-P3160]
MKKLGKLKLHDLSKAEMGKREQNVIKGGRCICNCRYAGTQSDPTDSYYGGAPTENNFLANGGY